MSEIEAFPCFSCFLLGCSAILFTGPPQPETCWSGRSYDKCDELILITYPWTGFEPRFLESQAQYFYDGPIPQPRWLLWDNIILTLSNSKTLNFCYSAWGSAVYGLGTRNLGSHLPWNQMVWSRLVYNPSDRCICTVTRLCDHHSHCCWPWCCYLIAASLFKCNLELWGVWFWPYRLLFLLLAIYIIWILSQVLLHIRRSYSMTDGGCE